MNRLAKIGLAMGGAAAAAGVLRKVLEPRPRYAPWEKPPYGEFPNKVLVLGGRFGGYTAAQTLCNLVRDRDDIGVMGSSPGTTSSPSGRWCRGLSAATWTSRT